MHKKYLFLFLFCFLFFYKALYSESLWEINTEKNNVITFSIPSKEKGSVKENSYLVVRYKDKKLSAFLYWNNSSIVDKSYKLSCKFGFRSAYDVDSLPSSDGKVSFIAPDYLDDFISNLRKYNKLVIKGEIYNKEVKLTFNIKGFEKVLEPYLYEMNLE